MTYTKGETRTLASYPCGCQVKEVTRAFIEYCPKHGAAPAMYEALKELLDHYYLPKSDLSRPYLADVVRLATKALAQAEGKV